MQTASTHSKVSVYGHGLMHIGTYIGWAAWLAILSVAQQKPLCRIWYCSYALTQYKFICCCMMVPSGHHIHMTLADIHMLLECGAKDVHTCVSNFLSLIYTRR